MRRLTYNPSSDMDPAVLPDGRLLFAGWQRSTLDYGFSGRISLFASQTDGLDYTLFAGDEGQRIKHMPCSTAGGLMVFVEADQVSWDGAGMLSCVSLRRPLHSYRPITDASEGLFHSPSWLPDGRNLVSRRPVGGSGTHDVYRFDPESKQTELVLSDSQFHNIQAKLVARRTQPDGRSSSVA